MQARRPGVHLCPFEVYANSHNYRDQKRTMPVGDMNLYLNLNQKFSIVCTWHFLFLMKLWLSTGVGGMNKTFLFFHCLILLWGELWYGKKKKAVGGELLVTPWGYYFITNYIYSSGTKVFQFEISTILLCFLLYSLHPDYVLVSKYLFLYCIKHYYAFLGFCQYFLLTVILCIMFCILTLITW